MLRPDGGSFVRRCTALACSPSAANGTTGESRREATEHGQTTRDCHFRERAKAASAGTGGSHEREGCVRAHSSSPRAVDSSELPATAHLGNHPSRRVVALVSQIHQTFH